MEDIYHQNLDTFEINKLPPRAYCIPEDAQLLNGQWAFELAPTVSEALYLARNEKSALKDTITVPSHWQLQGHGNPQYTNIKYPFPVDPPNVPTSNPTGVYRRTFEAVGDKQWRLRFDGVDSALWLFVNSKFVGFSTGSRNVAEFDVSDKLIASGQNTVTAVVAQWSLGSYIEDQDQWWLSGIFRDVYLIGFDKQGFIADYEFRTVSVDDPAIVDATVTVEGGEGDVTLSIEGVGQWTTTTTASKTKAIAKFKVEIPKPRLWSAEEPNLYMAKIVFNNHTVDTRIGVKVSYIKDGVWYVNHKPIKIKGVNRHDNHGTKGRAVSSDDVFHDLVLMKQHNVNSIRTSHYPSHPTLFHWADILGLYVMAEADLECHGFSEAHSKPAHEWTSNNPQWKQLYLDRMHRLVYDKRNHACVVMWSLGNESYFGHNHVEMYNWAKSISDFPVHYEADQKDRKTANVVDVFSVMYPGHDFVREMGELNDSKPFVLCEYFHNMSGSVGGLKEYMELFEKYPRIAGGWVWEWANHTLLTEGTNGKFMGYGGDFGEIVHDGTFVADGLCNGNHEPTPALVELKKGYQPVRFEFITKGNRVHVVTKNRNMFTSLDQYKFTIQVHQIPAPGDEAKKLTDLATAGGGVEMELRENTTITATAHLKEGTFWAPEGHEVAFDQYVHRTSSKSSNDAGAVTIGENDAAFVASYQSKAAHISKHTGKLLLFQDGKPVFTEPPSLEFWRAMTDNDLGGYGDNNPGCDATYWKGYYLQDMHYRLISVSSDGQSVTVHSSVAPSVVDWSVDVYYTYTFLKQGSNLAVEVDLSLDPKGNHPDTVPRVALQMVLTNEFAKKVKWFGLGEGESYPDCCTAQRWGSFELPIDSMYYENEIPQETGNRMEADWVEVSGERTLQVVKGDLGSIGFSVVPWTPIEMERAAHPCDLPDQKKVVFSVNFAHHGMGSAACGPGVLEQYKLKLRKREYSVKFVV